MKKLSKKITRILLIGGMLSSLLYIGTDILASCLYEGYSYSSQQISELSAIGAPTQHLWITMSFIWAPLVIAFGIGILQLSGPKRLVRMTGVLMAIYGIIGLLWNFAPMHQRGTVELTGDTLHIIFAGLQVLMIILFIILGSGADGTGFRIYSILTLIALLVFGAWTGTAVSAIAEGQSTPWMGIIERVNVYLSMVWVFVFAVVLLKSDNHITLSKKV